MLSKICLIYIPLCLLPGSNPAFALGSSKGATPPAASNANATDLMHLILAHMLSEADAAHNFVIAPQEILELYLQLHGTDKEIAAMHTAADAAEQQDGRPSDEVSASTSVSVSNDSSTEEFDEFFPTTRSTIVVSNTLYADVYNTQRFTRKLKNLQFVLLAEESAENTADGENDGETKTNKSAESSKSNEYDKNIDNNDAALGVTSKVHNNKSSKNNANNKINNRNNKRNELINAVRINSRWAHNFQKRDTHKRQFYMPQTHTHAYLNAMRKDDIFPYANLTELKASALELSLQRQELKILIILPHARDGLPQLLRRLSANVTLLDELCGMESDMVEQPTVAAAGSGVSQQRRHLDSTLVRVSLPQFQFTQRTNLDGVFKQLLNATANVDLHWPSAWQVTQETHFAVSEDGIGDLETSMVLFWNAFSSLRSKPLLFSVDHPFLFIVHNRRGIQLLGHLAQLHD
uniref:Putative serpin-like protein MM2675 n=1 Tax=Ceratitis capitata TaxID=7213 RepID=W8BNH5_CERCA